MTPSAPICLLPSFNEEERLPHVLRRLKEEAPGWRAVVVDDGSRDRTGDVARELGATVLTHPFNLGYGAALQTGYKYARTVGAELLVQMDADGQHDPVHLPKLLEPIEAGEADLVIGSRFLKDTAYEMSFARTIGRKLFQKLARSFGLEVTDPTSGFQAMNAKVLELYVRDFYPSDYPDIDVLLVAHRKGVRVQERSVVMNEETRPSTLHGGFRSVYYLYRLSLALWAGLSREGNR